MNVDKVIKWFMPKEERFHEFLEKATKNLLLSAQLFCDIAHSTSLEDRRIKGVQLKALEREGDDITRQIFEALNTTFITPFDREDIRSLACDLDEIIDHLESVAKYLVLFELREAPEALRSGWTGCSAGCSCSRPGSTASATAATTPRRRWASSRATGAIMGVGATKRISAVKWGVAGRIVWAWVLTIPLSAAVAAASWAVLHLLF